MRAFAPYLQYSAILDNRTRQSHRAAHGAVYHIDDPFWDYFYPPNGFNCRCMVKALSAADVRRQGLMVRTAELEDVQLVVNKKGDTHTATAVKLPNGTKFYADKGFEGNVGKQHLANLGQLHMQRAVDLPLKLASTAVNAAMEQSDLKAAISKQVAEMVSRVSQEKIARGQMLYIGALSEAVLDGLASKDIYPQSAVVAMSDERVLHGLRDTKVQPLPVAFWQELPDKLQEPEMILLGKAGRGEDAKQYLAFVYPLANGKGKLVVTLDYAAKSRHPITGKKEKLTVNMVNTGAVFDDERQLKSLESYEVVWKKP